MPTVLNVQQAPRLATFLTELQGLLHQRGEALAARAVARAAEAPPKSPTFSCCRQSTATKRWWITTLPAGSSTPRICIGCAWRSPGTWQR